MIKKIALLPLDSRPCNIKYPYYISKIAGLELFLPPKEALGNLKEKANLKELTDWLKIVSSEVNLLILSVDMLAFGGLVHSREKDIDDAETRLQLISGFKRNNPKFH